MARLAAKTHPSLLRTTRSENWPVLANSQRPAGLPLFKGLAGREDGSGIGKQLIARWTMSLSSWVVSNHSEKTHSRNLESSSTLVSYHRTARYVSGHDRKPIDTR